MSERVTLPVEGERGVVSWCKGVKLHGGEAAELSPDVRIIRTRKVDGVAVESGWLTFRLEPVRRVVRCSDGGTREVQTFRCWKPNGDQCELLVCGVCGDLCWGDVVDALEAATEGCRVCGAGLAEPGCITPHTFGSCFRCPASAPLFDAAAALTHSSHRAAMAAGGVSAEDRRSPQTDPPQTSNGLASGVPVASLAVVE